MNRRRYVRHYDDYAIGENEALYGAMAAKGWRLVRRGAVFSRFERAEPAAERYRIELASPDWLDDAGLPDEQIALYEECGWSFVTKRGLTHVFRAGEGSDAPEFYSDPRQQAATLRALRRQNGLAWLPVVFVLAFNFLMSAAFSGGLSGALRDNWMSFRVAWVEKTAVCLFYVVLMAYGIYIGLVAAVSTRRLYRHLRRGRPLNHTPGSAQRVLRAVGDGLMVVWLAFLALGLAQWLGRAEYALPQTADGPYLLMEDFGVSGERTGGFYDGRESEVTRSDSLAARHYDVYEAVETADGKTYWMFQDVYVLRGHQDAGALARALMAEAPLARGAESFSPVDVGGLDEAWCSGMEYVAVRGNLVCSLTYNEASSDEALRREILEALAACWAKAE